MRSTIRPAALVEAWFDMLPPTQLDLARELRAAVVAAEPQLAQSVKWGNLLFTLGGVHLLAIMTHRTHANLQVFPGSQLVHRFPQLEGKGKGLRHLRYFYDEPVEPDLVRAIVRACVEGVRGGGPAAGAAAP
jgi:uncharacterized protein YdhG (YjbR/CyaY superfamily)